MKFLLNMNVSPTLLSCLKNEGHNGWHVSELKMQRATDRQILRLAQEKDAVLLTCDIDYSEIIGIERMEKPSVILFRTSNIHPDYLFELLKFYWNQIENYLQIGVIIIIEDTGIRIRGLPMRCISGKNEISAC